ncbi:uncharacterized protein J3D65DRAFT_328214 [Phyllosticta citribraziliensis]|uniref:Uncharacterized protein n=1 Tax=Phyllosticta citribraziliensis TaxID=989973 RepID=A0ABR1LUM8_9PEZI
MEESRLCVREGNSGGTLGFARVTSRVSRPKSRKIVLSRALGGWTEPREASDEFTGVLERASLPPVDPLLLNAQRLPAEVVRSDSDLRRRLPRDRHSDRLTDLHPGRIEASSKSRPSPAPKHAAATRLRRSFSSLFFCGSYHLLRCGKWSLTIYDGEIFHIFWTRKNFCQCSPLSREEPASRQAAAAAEPPSLLMAGYAAGCVWSGIGSSLWRW